MKNSPKSSDQAKKKLALDTHTSSDSETEYMDKIELHDSTDISFSESDDEIIALAWYGTYTNKETLYLECV